MRMNPERGTVRSAIARQYPRVETRHIAPGKRRRIPRRRHRHQAQKRPAAQHEKSLADTVKAALPPRTSADDADSTVRRVFQAIRIAVNEEFGALDGLLRAIPTALKPGGRVAFLTFHSGEDRRVKKAFQEGERAGLYYRDLRRRHPPQHGRAARQPTLLTAKLRWAVRATE